jgi:hypothetical protein
MAGFSIPIAQLAEKAKLDLQTVARKSTVEVFGAVVDKTAVDTGRARANWNVSYGAPDTTTTDSTDAARGKEQAQRAAELPVGGVTYLSNSLPYIRPLEYGLFPDPPKKGSKKRGEAGYAIHVRGGYSMQSPQGMVRVTAREFDSYVRKVIDEK